MKISKKILGIIQKPLVLFPVLIVGAVLGWQAYLDAGQSFDTPSHNLLQNGSFEEWGEDGTPVGWKVTGHGGSPTIEVDSTKGYVDRRAMRVVIDDYEKGSVVIRSPKVTISEPGANYFFKAYYVTDIEFSLLVQYHYEDGTEHLQVLRHYPDYDYPWSTMSGGVVIDDSVVAISFLLHLADDGFIEMDAAHVIVTDIELTMPACPDDDNLIPNPTLDEVTADGPQAWDPYQFGDNQAKNELRVHDGNTFLRSAITRYQDGEAKWRHNPVSVLHHHRYCMSFDYRSDSKPELVIEYTLADGSVTYSYVNHLLPTTEWTEFSTQVEVPEGAVALSIMVNLASTGYVDTDNYQLVRMPGDGTIFNRPLVSITFDDGWESSYQNGAKVLDAYGMKGTYYINPGYIGEHDFMSRDQLESLMQRGHHLGSHGNLHIDLTAFNTKKVGKDLADAQSYLTDRLGVETVDFASPYGKHDAKADVHIKGLYASHRSTEPGVNTKQNFNAYKLKVLFMRRETTLDELRRYINDARTRNGWLILVYHQIEDADNTFIVSEPTLGEHLNEVKQSGLTVKSVRDALVELQAQRP